MTMQAERDLIRAQADAQATKFAGFAEAEVMRAKGYNQKDVLQAEVQMAYAEGIGNMTISGGGAGDVIGLGVGMAAAGAVVPQIGEMFKGFSTDITASVTTITTPVSPTVVENETKCQKCGAVIPANAKFCLECGEKIIPPVPQGMVACPECQNIVPKGKFCPECGHKFITACPKCGKEVSQNAKFCLECGEKL